MNKHYLIFQRMPVGHCYIDVACAETPLAAIKNYLAAETDCLLNEDGTVTSGKDHYPHPLAYIEANYKQHHEWQIRELPEAILNADFSEGVCTEDVGSLDAYFNACRPCLQREFPRSRARAFLWYLKEGALVTFYRRTGPYQIEILCRFRHQWDGKHLAITRWYGSYDDLLDLLLLTPRECEQSPC